MECATPGNLALDRRNVSTWDYKVDFLGRAPHSLITGDNFSSPESRHESTTTDDPIVRGFGKWKFTTASELGNMRVQMAGRIAGPCWITYLIVNHIDTPGSGVNLLDVGVGLFNGAGVEPATKFIRARLWNTGLRCDVCVAIDQSPAGPDTGEWGGTNITLPEGPFSLALVCNLNSLAVAIGDGGGKNFRIVSGWRTLTGFDMASDLILFGSPENDGNGGINMSWYCESSTVGSVFELSRAEWRYWNGVGTRETYLISDLGGNPIIEGGKVWMTTDRTMPYDTSDPTFLDNGAQVIACQYDPSNGQLGPETSRLFYKKDGRTTPAQNSKIVWDRAENAFHCYIPDWKNAMGWVPMLYARVDYADLRYGVHVIEPVELALPTNEYFNPDTNPSNGDFIFDAGPVRIGPNDYLLLVTWSDISRGFPGNYSRVLFRGPAPNSFNQIVGWDDDHGGEGHRLVRVGGKLWAICGSLERNRFHWWEIVPSENWMVYQGERLIEGFDWGRGDVPHYPSQPEIFGIPVKGGTQYHFTTFGAGQFDPTMNATTGSFFSAKSQKFPLA